MENRTIKKTALKVKDLLKALQSVDPDSEMYITDQYEYAYSKPSYARPLIDIGKHQIVIPYNDGNHVRILEEDEDNEDGKPAFVLIWDNNK